MCNDVGEGSRCCFFYSIVGFLFTLWVGVMLHTQPFFIGGIEDDEEAKKNAFGAMGMFLVTLLLSLVGMWYDANHKKDEIEATDGYRQEGYQLNTGDVPAYGTTMD